ncbi:hypothetical protein [Spirosoma validum]|nr:hypothetical protein [Spirosoma validum]
MAYGDQWKMLHMLNTSRTGKLTEAELVEMGIDCHDDTVQLLVDDGLVEYDPQHEVYRLNRTTRKMLNTFLVAMGSTDTKEIHINMPSCFVIMPFSKLWSTVVYEEIIKAAIEDANLTCIRGDMIPRVGKLANNVAVQIQEVGLIVAEISENNPNVFYELGIADSLGKDVFLLYDKTQEANLPADIQGAHYYAYNRSNRRQSREYIRQELEKWKAENKVDNVLKYCRA